MKRKKLKSIYLPFPGDQKHTILCIFFNFYIKLRHFLRRAPSYDVKYLPNNLNDLKNGFYDQKKTEIHIFTIFRRQKLKILWIFFNFYIKLLPCSIFYKIGYVLCLYKMIYVSNISETLGFYTQHVKNYVFMMS